MVGDRPRPNIQSSREDLVLTETVSAGMVIWVLFRNLNISTGKGVLCGEYSGVILVVLAWCMSRQPDLGKQERTESVTGR